MTNKSTSVSVADHIYWIAVFQFVYHAIMAYDLLCEASLILMLCLKCSIFRHSCVGIGNFIYDLDVCLIHLKQSNAVLSHVESLCLRNQMQACSHAWVLLAGWWSDPRFSGCSISTVWRSIRKCRVVLSRAELIPASQHLFVLCETLDKVKHTACTCPNVWWHWKALGYSRNLAAGFSSKSG